MKYFMVFLNYFLGTALTVTITLLMVGFLVELLFMIFYGMKFEFTQSDFFKYVKIGSIAGMVCGIGGVAYSFKAK